MLNTMSLLIKAEVKIVLAATCLCFAGCRQKPRATPPPPVVEVAPVTQADVPIYHEWIGTLDGLVNATIRAQVTGYLLTQDYREGDAIKKGDRGVKILVRRHERSEVSTGGNAE